MLLALVCFSGCSDSDEGIYFTQDEVVQGDILTGKQVNIGNSLTVYTGMGNEVYVQGGSGNLSAVSADEQVATVEVIQGLFDDSKYPRLRIMGVSVGNAAVTVTDERGNTATLQVKVEDSETLWSSYTYQKTSLIEDVCRVTGVSDEAAGAIRSDILTRKNKEFRFVFKVRSISAGLPSMSKLSVRDAEGNQLYELSDGYLTQKGQLTFGIVNADGVPEKTYTFSLIDDEQGRWLVEDLTYDYKAQYPGVQVELRRLVKKIG